MAWCVLVCSVTTSHSVALTAERADGLVQPWVGQNVTCFSVTARLYIARISSHALPVIEYDATTVRIVIVCE